MTFRIPHPNIVESDEGFSVEVLGRTGLRYVEGDRALNVNAEVLAGPSGIMLYSQSVDAADKVRIIENIRAAFKFRGFDIQVV